MKVSMKPSNKCEDNPKPIGHVVASLVPRRFVVAFVAALMLMGLLSKSGSGPAETSDASSPATEPKRDPEQVKKEFIEARNTQSLETAAEPAAATSDAQPEFTGEEAAAEPAAAKSGAQPESTGEETAAEPAAAKSYTFTDKMTKYSDLNWDELPQEAQDAVIRLGMDEDDWDNDEYPDEDWDELSDMHRKAAEDLGWDKESWDDHYSETDWEDLPENAKNAALSLGLTEETWDDDDWPAWSKNYWEDLDKERKRALMVLGWSWSSWDE